MTFDDRGVIRVEDAEGVRTITFDRPEVKNAFNQDLWFANTEALEDAAASPDIGCVVLTGAGDAFTAGQDLAEMADPSVFAERDEAPGYQVFQPVVEAFPKPLLAAVNGVAVGIGLTLLPHCDLVLMAEGARLKAPFVSLGVTTEASASVTLPDTIGWHEAAHLLFAEPWVDAETALRIGLAWRVCADDELLTETLALARRIAALPLEPLMTTKRLLLEGRLDRIRAARERELSEFERLIGEASNTGALASFLDKG